MDAIIKVLEDQALADHPASDKAWAVVALLTKEPTSAAEVTGWPEDKDEFEVFEGDLLGR